MADFVLQIIVLVFGVVALVIGRVRCREWINPLTIMVVCFFVPLFFALFRLARIQLPSWSYDTYVAMGTTIGAWLILPIILVIVGGQKYNPKVISGALLIETKEFSVIVRLFSIVVVVSYLVGNYIQAGTFFPATNPRIATLIHATFPFGIRLFAKANLAAAVLLYMLFYCKRNKIDLLLFALVLLVPLTRLSRIDFALSLVIIFVCFSAIPLFRWNSRRLTLTLSFLLMLIVGGAELGNLRTNQFGTYDIKYEQAIGWKPSVIGPGSVLPIAYGYFPLSFENFDAFVRQSKGERTYGLYSFDWLFTGIVKLNWIPGFREVQSDGAKFEPISGAAAVPTALFPFYADFGAIFMLVPMVIYLGLWFVFYYRSRRNYLSLALFAVYTSGFALSSFQAVIASPVIFQQLVEMAVIFWVAKRWSQKRMRSDIYRVA